MGKLRYEHEPTPMLVGKRLYALEGNTITVKEERVSDYHKREYDYYLCDKLQFQDDKEAKNMWYKLRSFFNLGYEECQADFKKVLSG